MIKTHKDLDAWKYSISLVTEIYNITKVFPDSEKYGLISQIRRCAVSVPSNIAEGAGRHHDKEFIQFSYIALGSLTELETQLIISCNLGYISKKQLEGLDKQIGEIRGRITGLINYLKKKVTG